MTIFNFNSLLFLILIFDYSCSLRFTKQDILRMKLGRLENFDVISRQEFKNIIKKWKIENKNDQEYFETLDNGMKQIIYDDNVFPLFVNAYQSEYLLINLISTNDNVNLLNILENKNNCGEIDTYLIRYHIYLLENGYNPNYYELKTTNQKQFLNVLFLNFLDNYENDMIRYRKNNYMKFLEQDTKNKKDKR